MAGHSWDAGVVGSAQECFPEPLALDSRPGSAAPAEASDAWLGHLMQHLSKALLKHLQTLSPVPDGQLPLQWVLIR